MSRRLYLMTIITVSMLLLMVLMPEVTASGTKKGIDLWLESIVPTLLPFFIVSNFIKNLGIPMFFSWKVYPFVMAMLSGYPIGARISADYYNEKIISYNQMLYLLSYSMVTGPAFIIGAVGAEFLDSTKWGIIIALGHYLGAIANGVLYKSDLEVEKSLVNNNISEKKSISDAITIAIVESLKSMAIILAYIIIFMIIIYFIDETRIFNYIIGILPREYGKLVEGVSKGLIEMTIGSKIISLSSASLILISTCISFIISFGGFSVIGQSLTMLNNTNISIGQLLKIKLTHGILAAVLTFSFGTFMLYF